MNFIKKAISYILFSNIRIKSNINLLLDLKKKNKLKWFRLLIQEHLRKNYHVLISDTAVIGSIRLPHPHNVCIGRDVQIGENCTLYHDVSIGQSYDKFPKLGNNVIVYTGAKIMGDVTVGDNAVIGVNAVVISDVPANAIVGGIPAKIIRYRTEQDNFH